MKAKVLIKIMICEMLPIWPPWRLPPHFLLQTFSITHFILSDCLAVPWIWQACFCPRTTVPPAQFTWNALPQAHDSKSPSLNLICPEWLCFTVTFSVRSSLTSIGKTAKLSLFVATSKLFLLYFLHCPVSLL